MSICRLHISYLSVDYSSINICHCNVIPSIVRLLQFSISHCLSLSRGIQCPSIPYSINFCQSNQFIPFINFIFIPLLNRDGELVTICQALQTIGLTSQTKTRQNNLLFRSMLRCQVIYCPLVMTSLRYPLDTICLFCDVLSLSSMSVYRVSAITYIC